MPSSLLFNPDVVRNFLDGYLVFQALASVVTLGSGIVPGSLSSIPGLVLPASLQAYAGKEFYCTCALLTKRARVDGQSKHRATTRQHKQEPQFNFAMMIFAGIIESSTWLINEIHIK